MAGGPLQLRRPRGRNFDAVVDLVAEWVKKAIGWLSDSLLSNDLVLVDELDFAP